MEGVPNPKRRHVEFAAGDMVWLSTAHLPLKTGARKLAARFAGPFAVDARISREAYRLKLPSTWKVHPVFHTSQLKAVCGELQKEAAV